VNEITYVPAWTMIVVMISTLGGMAIGGWVIIKIVKIKAERLS